MTDVTLSFEVDIDAPVHTVFEYCRDPRSIYAGDPTYNVADATLTTEGLGTRARLVAKMLVFTEDVAIDYVEIVPDQRIVFEARPKMTITRLGRFVIPGSLHTWTWTFAPEDGRTRLTVSVVEHDAPRRERALDALSGPSRRPSRSRSAVGWPASKPGPRTIAPGFADHSALGPSHEEPNERRCARQFRSIRHAGRADLRSPTGRS